MINKTFGQFDSVSEDDSSVAELDSPPILGAPMPNPGIKNKTLGSVFPQKDKPTPSQFSGRAAASKRLQGMPDSSPLGPITGMQAQVPMRRQAQPPATQPPSVGTGDRWMGELWQGLTLDGEPQGGYAMGGSVQSGMDLYNQTIASLESGGVAGFKGGGSVQMSREIASKGRNGDTMLMHINPGELEGLQSLLGPVTINPDTGNPEAFAWFMALPFMAKLAVGAAAGGAAGAGIGAITGGKEGALKGLALGTVLGTGGAGLASLAPAGVAGGAGASAVAGPVMPAYAGAANLAQSAAMGSAQGATALNAAGITGGQLTGATAAKLGTSLAGNLLKPQTQQESPMQIAPPAPQQRVASRPVTPREANVQMRRQMPGIGGLAGSRRLV